MNNIKLFKKISKSDYKIKKDDKHLYIIYDNNKIKCSYLFLMISQQLDNNLLNIIWTDANPYIDQETRNNVKEIRKILSKEYSFLLDNTNQIIRNDDLQKVYDYLIKNPNKLHKINQHIEWIITNKNKHDNYIEYFILTDII